MDNLDTKLENIDINSLNDDCKGHDNPTFNQSTLEIQDEISDNDKYDLNKLPDVNFNGPNFERNSQSRASIVSRTSQGTLSSRTSIKNVVYPEKVAKNYFCKRDKTFEKAQEQCKTSMIDSKIDGDFIGAWILVQVDHWDIEHERIVILCENSVIIGSYDFIRLEPLHGRRVLYVHIKKTKVGDLMYPEKSWMTPRQHGGIQLIWDDDKHLTFTQRWNPVCQSIPYVTLIHHPLIYHENEQETATYNVDDFFESFAMAANNAYKKQDPNKNLIIEEAPIVLESYVGLTATIFNQSHLGYSRERGGISF